MVQILEQEDYGEKLGKSIGSGVSSGANILLKAKLNDLLSQQKAKQAFQQAQSKPFTVFETQGNLGKLGISKEELSFLEPEDIEEITIKANEYIPTLGRDQAFVKALQEKFNPTTEGSSMPAGLAALNNEEQSEEDGIWPSLKRGIESGTAGRVTAIGKGEGAESFKKRTSLKSDKFLPTVAYNLGAILSDIPSFIPGGAAGGALGSAAGPIGATVGAGAGAFGAASLINQGLEEYQKYIDKGYKGSFGDFLDAADTTLQEGIKGTAEGAVLASLGPLKFLSKVPGGKKLLKLKGGKAAEKILDTAAKTGLFTGAQGVAEQRIPTFKEYAANLGTFLGLDLFHNAGKYSKNIYSKLQKANIAPKEAAVKIQERVQEKGYDLSNPKDVVRVVTDITKEPSKAKEVFAERAVVEKPELTPKEIAERVAERPVEDYLAREEKAEKKKNAPLTEKEESKRATAKEESAKVEKKLETIDRDINYLEETLDKKGLKKDQKKVAQLALEQKNKERDRLRRQYEDLSDIAEKGKKRYREEDLQESIDNHLEKVRQAALNPEAESSKSLSNLFEKDQKHIDQAIELSSKGKLPDAPFIDRYIKTLEAYQKAYVNVIDKLKSQTKDMSPQNQKVLKKHLDLMEKNYEINKSKIAKQKDKLKTLHQLKIPGSALVKQHLKSLRNDIKSIQKDFIKQIELEGKAEQKITEAADKALIKEKTNIKEAKLKNSEQLSEKIRNHDFSEEIKNTSKKSKVTFKRLKDVIERLKPEISGIVDAWNTDPSQGIRKARQLYRHLPFTVQVLASSIISEGLKSMGVPAWVAYMIQPSNYVIRSIGSGVGIMAKNKWKDIKYDSYVSELVSKRNKSLGEATNYINKLKKDLKPKEVKEVMKRYSELKASI